MSDRVLHILTLIFCVALGCTVIGCAAQPPIVADPPEHTHTAPEIVPWEEQYARMRPKPEVFEDDLGGAGQRVLNRNRDQRAEDRGFVGVVADIIAFPFRGLGWVIQQVF